MVTATATKAVEVTMNRERETKNTWRYIEDAPEDEQKIGTLYVPKATLADMGDPDAIKVQITAE